MSGPHPSRALDDDAAGDSGRCGRVGVSAADAVDARPSQEAVLHGVSCDGRAGSVTERQRRLAGGVRGIAATRDVERPAAPTLSR
jgi:hypothetical protein